VSVTELYKKGVETKFIPGEGAVCIKNDRVLIRAKLTKAGLFEIQQKRDTATEPITESVAALAVESVSAATEPVTEPVVINRGEKQKHLIALWHQRLAHTSLTKMKQMKSLPEEVRKSLEKCERIDCVV